MPEAKTARYVRLYIDGYTANAADDQTNWRSVSLYDFQIYANEIPDTVLPDENYCLEGTAEASNFEEVQSEPGKQGPAKAIDGDLTTRWATESDGKGTTPYADCEASGSAVGRICEDRLGNAGKRSSYSEEIYD